jgi:hypothetical protein
VRRDSLQPTEAKQADAKLRDGREQLCAPAEAAHVAAEEKNVELFSAGARRACAVRMVEKAHLAFAHGKESQRYGDLRPAQDGTYK